MVTTNAAGETYEEVRRRKLEENRRKVDRFNREVVAFAAANPPPRLFSIMTSNNAGEPYDEARRRKLEENRNKLEELKLRCLSKPSPLNKETRKVNTLKHSHKESKKETRKPCTLKHSHKKIIHKVVQRPRKISKHRDLSGRVYASDEAREYAIEKAGEVEARMGTDYPSFVKPMLQSHTTGGFWLGLPIKFCNKYLPKSDSSIILVDENGDKSNTTYLAHKRGLSAGWRGFSIDHGLVDGDALVFHLINQTTFKVYIIRAKNYYSS